MHLKIFMTIQKTMQGATLLTSIFFLFILQAVGANKAYPPEIAGWSETVKSSQRLAGARIMTELRQAAAKGEPRFTIPPGDYRFDDAGISNHLELTATNLVVEATGATFWIEEDITRFAGIRFKACHNMAFRGLAIDYDPLPFVQGEILSLDPESKSLIFRVDEGFMDPGESKRGLYFGPEAFKYSKKAVFFRPNGDLAEHRMESVIKIEPLGKREYRVTFSGYIFLKGVYQDRAKVKAGDYLVIPPRRSEAIGPSANVSCLFENITLYATPNMGISERNSSGNIYRSIRIVKRPNTARLIAGNADGFHSYSATSGPTLENSEISHTCDDFVNIHSIIPLVYEKISPQELILHVSESSTMTPVFRPFDIGTQLSFNHSQKLTPEGQAVVTKIERVGDEVSYASKLDAFYKTNNLRTQYRVSLWKVALNTPVSAESGSLVGSPLFHGNGFVVRSNYFHHTLARAVLGQGRDGRIEGNRIEHTGFGAIVLGTETFWLEGPFPGNITIENNKLSDIATTPSGQLSPIGAAISVFWIGLKPHEELSPHQVIFGVKIKNNTIERCNIAGIQVVNAANFEVTGNTILSAMQEPKIINGGGLKIDPLSGIYLASVSNGVVENNRIEKLGSNAKSAVLRGKWVDPSVRVVE